MPKPTIPAGLPDSALLRALAEKTAALKTAQSRTPAYLEWLKTLRDRIAPDVSETCMTARRRQYRRSPKRCRAKERSFWTAPAIWSSNHVGRGVNGQKVGGGSQLSGLFLTR